MFKMNKKPIYEKMEIIKNEIYSVIRKNEFVSDICIEIDDIISDFDFLISFFNTKNVKSNVIDLKREIELELPYISVKIMEEQIDDAIRESIDESILEIRDIDFYCTIVLKDESKALEKVWKE